MSFGKSVNFNRTPGASIGSKATSSAMQKAASTASGSNRPSPQPRSLGSQKQISSQPKRSISRGSAAGLNTAASVHLNRNGAGYLNPRNQTARLKGRTKTINTSVSKSLPQVSGPKMNKNFDSRLTCSNKSSISLMNKKIR